MVISRTCSKQEKRFTQKSSKKETALGDLYIYRGSAIFLKKIGSGMHSDPKFGQRGGGFSCNDARRKGSGTVFGLASF
jgi:hypothetical protein